VNSRGRCWWVAPSYGQASGAWRELKDLARQLPGVVVREDERRITVPGGGLVEVKSAESGANLRGAGLHLVVVDEAAFIPEELWTAVLRPALSDQQGKALLISTPSGFNWFYQAWQRGQDATPGWCSWRFATVDSPFIAAAEVADARASLPERIFRQEYEADFTDVVGAVFRGVRDAATATPQDRAIPGHGYVVGCDWAGAGHDGDYTVFSVVDATERALVHLDRFRGAEYAIQRARLVALWERFGRPPVIAEANSMGEPVVEELRRDGVPVRPFVTTNASKALLVDALALAFEQRSIRVLDDPVLVGELLAFAAERLPSGLTRYAARYGHDDTVMSLALAWSGAAAPRRNSAIGAFL